MACPARRRRRGCCAPPPWWWWCGLQEAPTLATTPPTWMVASMVRPTTTTAHFIRVWWCTNIRPPTITYMALLPSCTAIVHHSAPRGRSVFLWRPGAASCRRQLTGRDGRGKTLRCVSRRNTHDHQWLHPLLTQPRHHPNHAPTRAHPATSDPTVSRYSPPMPRTGVGHAGALYGRVYGDPD